MREIKINLAQLRISYTMMLNNHNFAIQIVLFYVNNIAPMSLLHRNSFSEGGAESDSDIADLILSKGYLPNDKELPEPETAKSENDATYLLSKLPDSELIKLLDEHPMKNEFDVKDLVQLALEDDIKYEFNNDRNSINQNVLQNAHGKSIASKPFFRLNNKPVLPQTDSKADYNYSALQKINSLLNSQPQETADDGDNREMIFDVLVAQLKTLCCKGPKGKKEVTTLAERNDIFPYLGQSKNKNNANYKLNRELKQQIIYRTVTTEHMFLILNEEVKSNGSNDLIAVDPESLGKNSSVLLLGPLNRPLSDGQLKAVMKRISNELSKPEYSSILKQLSEGTLKSPNLGLMKKLITGPETRRYIKPHRCNYQSTIAKVFGGTRWIICTGYLNINTPSFYD